METKSTTIEYGSGKKVTITRDDCIRFLKSLPDESVDVIATDPAYSGMNGHLKLGKGRIVGKYADKGKQNGKWFAEFEDTEENYQVFLAECGRILKKDTGHLYIMFDSFSLLSLAPLVRKSFDVKNVLVWDKVNLGMGHFFRRRHELIVFATNRNKRKISSRSFPDIWRVKRLHGATYPTQKPVEVFDIMLAASGQPGFTVCDPFLGSGSAAIAAVRADCNFVGCDISERAYQTSLSRVKQYVKTHKDSLQPSSLVPEGEPTYWKR